MGFDFGKRNEGESHLATAVERIRETDAQAGGVRPETAAEAEKTTEEWDEDDDLYGGGSSFEAGEEGGLAGLYGKYQKLAVAGAVGVLLLTALFILLGFNPAAALFGGGGGAESGAAQEVEGGAAAAAQQAPQAPSIPAEVLPVEEKDIRFEAPVERDGVYYLGAGEQSWKGKLETGEDGETLKLEGPTAAQFKGGLSLDGGRITNGIWGRAVPDGPTQHATAHRALMGTKDMTLGTYFVVQDGAVTGAGFYVDEPAAPDAEGVSKVTRTYVALDPNNPAPGVDGAYAVRYDAASGAPVPSLVGLKDEATATAEASQSERE